MIWSTTLGSESYRQVSIYHSYNKDRGTYSAGVAQLILLAGENLSQNTAHNLARARLGQVGNDKDGLGRGKGTDALADLHDKLLAQGVVDLVALLDGDKGVDGLAGELVGDADNGGLGDGVVLDEGGLNLGGGETVAGDVDNVVDAAADPVEALVIAGGTVTGKLVGLAIGSK